MSKTGIFSNEVTALFTTEIIVWISHFHIDLVYFNMVYVISYGWFNARQVITQWFIGYPCKQML